MSSLIFNAVDVCEVAKKIERNGQTFYAKAAEVMPDAESKKVMLDLEAMERAHEKIYEELQAALSGSETEETLYDPHDEAYKFLRRMADQYVFDPQERPERVFEPGMPVEAILDVAIEREKDSIIFYEGIKAMVPEKYGRSRISDIIEEEMSHVILLSSQKQRLQKT